MNGALERSMLAERNHADSSVDVHFRALLWIQSHRHPTAANLARHLQCSRSTAHRYLVAWRRVTGQPESLALTSVSQPSRARARVDHPWSRRHDR